MIKSKCWVISLVSASHYLCPFNALIFSLLFAKVVFCFLFSWLSGICAGWPMLHGRHEAKRSLASAGSPLGERAALLAPLSPLYSTGPRAWPQIWVHVQLGSSGPQCTKWADDQHSQTELEPRLVPDLTLTITDLQVIDLVSSPVWWEAETNIGNFNECFYCTECMGRWMGFVPPKLCNFFTSVFCFKFVFIHLFLLIYLSFIQIRVHVNFLRLAKLWAQRT